MRSRLWIAANGIMLVLFLFAAAVQFNDPDPFGWMAVYVAAAAICGLELLRRASRLAAGSVAVVALGWAASIGHRSSDLPSAGALFAEWEMRDIAVEQAREMYGLAVVGIWMLAIVAAKRSPTARQ